MDKTLSLLEESGALPEEILPEETLSEETLTLLEKTWTLPEEILSEELLP